MVSKKWFLTVAVLGAVLATAAAYLSQETLQRQPLRREAQANAAVGGPPAVKLVEVTGACRGFGPAMEALLPAAESDGQTEILNLETGRWLTTPRLEELNGDAGVLTTWIRTNGLNISGRIWPEGLATCDTYNMAVFPLETRHWEDSVAEDITGMTLSSANQHTPRRLLILASGRPTVYAFRTDEGTLGMLRLVGLSDDRRAVKIRYKLVQALGEPAQHIATK